MKKVFLLSYFDISDICVYLASVLNRYGKKVVVVDETKEYFVKYFINAEEENMDVFEYQDVEYSFSHRNSEELKDVDVMIIYTNKRMIIPQIDIDDEVFMFVNQDRRLLLKLKAFIEVLGLRGFKSITRVIQFVDSKIDKDYINKFLENENVSIIEDIEIYYDETDYQIKIENSFNLKLQFKKISKEFKNALTEILKIILKDEIEDKRTLKVFNKAFRAAERGGRSAGLFSKQ